MEHRPLTSILQREMVLRKISISTYQTRHEDMWCDNFDTVFSNSVTCKQVKRLVRTRYRRIYLLENLRLYIRRNTVAHL